MRLTESLIKKLEADIRRGLNDAQLRKKHDIPEPTWRRWKNKGKKDRYNELTTIYITLLDKLREGREEITEQIKNVLVKVALGEWMYVTTKTYKDASGEIIKTVEKIATEPDLKAVKFMLNYLDPEHWGEHKKTEITRINVIVPESVEEDEWLRECALRHAKYKQQLKQQKEAEKQLKQRERVVKPIEYAVIEKALGIWKRVSATTWTDESGEIIGTVETTTTPPPSLKAAEYWLSHRDPEFWSKYKKPEISIGEIIPDPGLVTEEEWLQKYGPNQTNPTQPKEAEKQPEPKEAEKQPEPKEAEKQPEPEEAEKQPEPKDKFEADIREGLFDFQLREKHGISKSTWYDWKYKGVIDRNNGLETLHTMLFDRLQEGREVVKQIENILIEIALGEVVFISITTYRDGSGKIIDTDDTTTKLPPNRAAREYWLSHHDPEIRAGKKRELISSIRSIVPDYGKPTEEEWLQQYAPKQPEQKAKTDDKPDDK